MDIQQNSMKCKNMNTRLKRLFENIKWLFLLQVCSYIFPIISFPYLAQKIEISQYGIYVYILTIMGYYQVLLDFGFTLSGTQRCAENKHNKEKVSTICSSIIIIKFALAFIGIVFLYVLKILSIIEEQFNFFVLMYVAFCINAFLPDYLFRGMESMSVFAKRNLLTKILFMLILISFIKKEEDFCYIPLAYLIPNIVAFFISWYLAKKYMFFSFVIPKLEEIYEEFKCSLFYFFSRVANLFTSSINIIVLGIIYNNSEIAIFGVASKMIDVIRSLFTPVSDAFFPYMLTNKNFRLLKKSVFISFFISSLIAGVLFLIIPYIIKIFFGNEYLEAVYIFRLMLPLIIIALPIYLLGYPTLCALKKDKWANISVIVEGVFQTTGLLLLFIYNMITFTNVIFLTICSEVLILSMRSFLAREILFKNDR